ncbi:TPA: hypothetical protein ACGOZ6_000216 [Streptococcus suis]
MQIAPKAHDADIANQVKPTQQGIELVVGVKEGAIDQGKQNGR